MEYEIYCLSYNNEARRQSMQTRFQQLDLCCNIYTGVNSEDARLCDLDAFMQKIWSCIYGHLDMIAMFYETNKPYGIFCEDDIMIHRNFKDAIPSFIDGINALNLDVLLIGYLTSFVIHDWHAGFSVRHENAYKFHHFPDHIWGTQMYMLTRDHAKLLLDTYATGYAEASLTDTTLTPFSADWILTKVGNRALITPMIVVEDNTTIHEDGCQSNFHGNCHRLHYTDEFI